MSNPAPSILAHKDGDFVAVAVRDVGRGPAVVGYLDGGAAHRLGVETDRDGRAHRMENHDARLVVARERDCEREALGKAVVRVGVKQQGTQGHVSILRLPGRPGRSGPPGG